MCVQLDAMHELGQIADEVMTVVIDMHLTRDGTKNPA